MRSKTVEKKGGGTYPYPDPDATTGDAPAAACRAKRASTFAGIVEPKEGICERLSNYRRGEEGEKRTVQSRFRNGRRVESIERD